MFCLEKEKELGLQAKQEISRKVIWQWWLKIESSTTPYIISGLDYPLHWFCESIYVVGFMIMTGAIWSLGGSPDEFCHGMYGVCIKSQQRKGFAQILKNQHSCIPPKEFGLALYLWKPQTNNLLTADEKSRYLHCFRRAINRTASNLRHDGAKRLVCCLLLFYFHLGWPWDIEPYFLFSRSPEILK